MDALTHAIEAYVSTLHCAFTDPLALQAIEMVFDYLPASYNGNMTAREEMHYAQCLAGMAFSNALLGIVHSMAHKTGAAFSTGHITHGCANAMYLPFVIKYNAKEATAASRYAEIARRMGLAGASEQALINSRRRCMHRIQSENDRPGCHGKIIHLHLLWHGSRFLKIHKRIRTQYMKMSQNHPI